MNFLTNRPRYSSPFCGSTAEKKNIYGNANGGTDENFNTVKWCVDEKPSCISDLFGCTVYCAIAEERFRVWLKRLKFALRKEFHENEQNVSCFRIDDVLTQSSNLSNVVPLWQFSHSKISIETVALLGTQLKMNTLVLCANIKFATWRFPQRTCNSQHISRIWMRYAR